MNDFAHKQADKTIEELTKELNAIYSESQNEMLKKAQNLFGQLKKEDEIKRKMVENGQLKASTYKRWRKQEFNKYNNYKIFVKRYSNTITQNNINAQQVIKQVLPEVFGNNANFTTYRFEKDLNVSTDLTLYSESVVKNIVENDPNLLKVKDVDVKKSTAYNKKILNKELAKGIIQGEPIDRIAERLTNVVKINEKFALTKARTAVTMAENSGRIYQMKKIENELGIKTQKKWLSTIDGRTRTTHILADGLTVNADDDFKLASGAKLKYPGDSSAPGEEVYNCRCTITYEWVGKPKGYAEMNRYNSEKYKEWKKLGQKEWSEKQNDRG